MAIQIRGSGTNTVGTASTTNTVTASAAPQTGDIILLFYEQDPASSGAYGTLTPSDSMGSPVAQCSQTNWSRLTLWGKVSSGSEGTGFTITNDTSQSDTAAAVLILYDDALGTLSLGTGQTTVDASSGGTWGYPAVTTTSADSWVVIGVGGGGNVSHGSAAIFSGWGSFTEQLDIANNGAWSAIGVGTQYVATASTVSAGTITSITTDVSLGVGIEVIRTAGGGGATATTFTGPSAGVDDVQSTDFTVGANGTITGTVTCTFTNSLSGTWSFATRDISSGTPTQTVKYTPSVAGTHVLGVTDNGGLADATSINYVVASVSRPSAVAAGTWTDEAGGSLVVSDINDNSDSTGAMDPANTSYDALPFTADTPLTAASQTFYFRGRNIVPGKQVRQVIYANDGTTVVATGAWKTMTSSIAEYSDILTPTAPAYKGQIQVQVDPGLPSWFTAITAGNWGTIAIGTLSASGKLQTGGGSVWSAWGGAVVSETGVYNGTSFVTGPSMVAFGGGHTDYAGNELYAIADLLNNTPVYLRLRDKSSPDVSNTDQNGGGDPVARHTYQTISWLGGSNNGLFSFGYLFRYVDSGGSTTSHYCNFNQSNPNVNQPWSTKTAVPGGALYSAWDSVNNVVWAQTNAANDVSRYNVGANTYDNALFMSPIAGTNPHSAIDTVRQVWFTVWSGSSSVQGKRTGEAAINTSDYYTVSTTGTAPASAANKSIIYDPVDDRFVVYSGNGKQIFFLTPPASLPYPGGNPWVWSSTTPGGGDTPGTQQTNGTFGRFGYIPAPIRGYLLWNSSTEQPIFFKPT